MPTLNYITTPENSLEKTTLTPEFINLEKAKWYIFTMSVLIKNPFQDIPEIGIGFVDFEGSNHQQIDLKFFKENNLTVCGMTLSKSAKLGVKDVPDTINSTNQ